jgi:hypothetical protein
MGNRRPGGGKPPETRPEDDLLAEIHYHVEKASELLDELGCNRELSQEGRGPPVRAPTGPTAGLKQMGLPGIRLEQVSKKQVQLTVPDHPELEPLRLSPRQAKLLEHLTKRACSRKAKESPDAAWMTYEDLEKQLSPDKDRNDGFISQVICRLRQRGWIKHFVITSRKLRSVRLKLYISPLQTAAR